MFEEVFILLREEGNRAETGVDKFIFNFRILESWYTW